jgi:hypothetical protein
VSRARNRSRETSDHAEILSDEDFDTDEFVEKMDDRHCLSQSRAGWRRLEEIRELRELKRDLDDWADLND